MQNDYQLEARSHGAEASLDPPEGQLRQHRLFIKINAHIDIVIDLLKAAVYHHCNLEVLHVTIAPDSENAQVQLGDIFLCCPKEVEELDLSGVTLSTFDQLSTQLSSLENLKRVKFPTHAYLSRADCWDTELAFLASWTSLQELSLPLGRFGSTSVTGLSLHGLTLVATYCPQLYLLRVLVNLSNEVMQTWVQSESLLDHPLKNLHIGSFPIPGHYFSIKKRSHPAPDPGPSTNVIVSFSRALYALFPHIENFYTIPDYSEGVWTEVRGTVELIAKACKETQNLYLKKIQTLPS